MNSTRWLRKLGLIAAVAMLTSCSAHGGSTASKPVTVVHYSAFKVPDPAYVASKKGFFTKRGISVDFVENPGGTTGLQAISAGRTDVATAPISALVSAVGQKLPVQGVADEQSALPGSPIEEFFVRANGGIGKVADLKGKKIAVNGVGGSFQQTIIIALEKAGLTANDVQFTVIPFAQQTPALLAGSVDMIGLLPPYSTKAAAVYPSDVKKLFDALDVLGTKQFVLYATNTAWAAKNADALRAFVAGIAEATEWVKANPDEARTLLADYVGVDAQYMPVPLFQPHAAVVPGDISYWIDYMQRHGDLKNPVRATDIATNSYNAQASG